MCMHKGPGGQTCCTHMAFNGPLPHSHPAWGLDDSGDGEVHKVGVQEADRAVSEAWACVCGVEQQGHSVTGCRD
jgi:hypothetical protein